MHLLYDKYMSTISEQLVNLTSQSMLNFFNEDWIREYMGIDNSLNIIDQQKRTSMQLNYDVEKKNLMAGADTFENFINNFLKLKFAISDVDYTLIIETNTYERYLILHEISIHLLSKALDKITTKFDVHLQNALDGIPAHYTNYNISAYDTEKTFFNLYLDILTTLKKCLSVPTLVSDLKSNINPAYFIVHVVYSSNNDVVDVLPLKERIIILIKNIYVLDIVSIFELYNLIEIVTCVMYLDSINSHFLNHGKNTNSIFKNLSNLFTSKYYTLDDLNAIKNILADMYTKLPANSPMLNPKISKTFGKPTPDVYVLINHQQITSDDITFQKRDSAYLYCATKLPSYEIESTHEQKYHYMTYNASILKMRNREAISFDLLRSKVNLVMLGNYFTKNNILMSEMPLESEFIDISVPRFEDLGYQIYNEHLHKMNNPYNMPYILCMKIGMNKYIIKSYGPEDISQDILFVLLHQNQVEPWLDNKYAKRIVRYVFFAVLNCLIDKIVHEIVSGHPAPTTVVAN